MTRFKFFAAGLFLTSALASTSALAGDPQDALYTSRLQGTLTVGKEGPLTLEITPTSGYKWNKDYPAKLELANGKVITFSKAIYKKAEGDIAGDEHAGKVTIKAKGATRGSEKLTGKLSFSLCNAETCQVLRQRPIPLEVTVK